jgi:hypothetical protein
MVVDIAGQLQDDVIDEVWGIALVPVSFNAVGVEGQPVRRPRGVR